MKHRRASGQAQLAGRLQFRAAGRCLDESRCGLGLLCRQKPPPMSIHPTLPTRVRGAGLAIWSNIHRWGIGRNHAHSGTLLSNRAIAQKQWQGTTSQPFAQGQGARHFSANAYLASVSLDPGASVLAQPPVHARQHGKPDQLAGLARHPDTWEALDKGRDQWRSNLAENHKEDTLFGQGASPHHPDTKPPNHERMLDRCSRMLPQGRWRGNIPSQQLATGKNL